MTIANLISDAQARLSASGSASPRLDAEVLLRHAAGWDRTQLFMAMQDEANHEVVTHFRNLVDQRIAGTPVAYLTGHREFMGLDFSVTPDVLIPRPETELLVEWAVQWLNTMPGGETNLVDVGAGSGAIAISIAALAKEHHVMLAIEPSAQAREIISRNATSLLTSEQQSSFIVSDGDLLAEAAGPFTMVMANLPYLTPTQIAGNPDLDAEPRMALDGGGDGLDLIERLVHQLPTRLTESCAVGLEIDPAQSVHVVKLLQRTLPGADMSVITDLAGHDRHVVATRDNR